MGACEAGVGVLTSARPVVEGSASALAAAKITAIADVKCVCVLSTTAFTVVSVCGLAGV